MTAKTLWLRVQAPFAAYRPLAAGVFRGTALTMSHSSAYGLLMNLAGLETRGEMQRAVTGMREGLPSLRIAVGDVKSATVSSLYQQLHSYPVGAIGKEFRERTRGTKYWIAPVRREVLVGLDVMLGVQSSSERVLERIPKGLHGTLEEPRYGLPFAGDNNLLFDAITVMETPMAARWYVPLQPGDLPQRGGTRLTTAIDREDSSLTRSMLFAPVETAVERVPETAWVWTPVTPNE